MNSPQTLQRVFDAINTHKRTTRYGVDHRNAFHQIITHHYPSYFVVSVDPYCHAEFMDYAEAGFASATLDDVNGHFEVQRRYNPPRGGRLSGRRGKAVDTVFFGKYKYEWRGREYGLFHVGWKNVHDRDVPWDFVLFPRAESTASVEGGSKDCPEIDELLVELGHWSSTPHEDIYVFDNGRVSRSKSTWESVKDASWDDVILDPGVKAQLMKDVQGFFTEETRDIYLKYQIPYKRGILLHGLPGNGKTSTIRALIAHLMRLPDPVPTIYVKSTLDKCNGDQKSIQKIFEMARRMAPCCMVLEDLDSLVNEAKVRSYFLNEMDGLEANDGILIVGSTNHLDEIDEAIRSRPSRFDRKYAFNVPSRAEREAYAKYWFEKLKDNVEVDFKEEMCAVVADLTDEFSFAFMKELFVSALVMIARKAVGDEIDWDVIGPRSAEPSVKGDVTPQAVLEKETVVTKDEKADNSTEEIKKKENAEEKKNGSPKKREIPKVEVPDTLKDNTFYKLIYLNTGVLLQNMDDNEKAEGGKKKENKKSKSEDADGCTDGSCSHPS